MIGLESVPTVLEGVFAAAIYGGLWYARAYRQGEAFDSHKFAATLVVGAVVGMNMAATGGEVTQSSIETRLVAMVGVITAVEAILKTIVNTHENLEDGDPPAEAVAGAVDETADEYDLENAGEVRDAVEELEQGGEDDESDHEAPRADGSGWPTGLVKDLPDTVPFYSVQGETDYEFAYYCGTCAEQGEHPVVRVEDASRHRRSHDGEGMRIRRVEFGTPGESLGLEEPNEAPRSPTRADGGRSFSTNPEVCPECGMTLKNGECRTGGCPGPDGGESA